MCIVGVLILDRLSQCRIEGTGVVGTRTVPVPGSGEPNIQGNQNKNSSCSRKWGTKYTRCLYGTVPVPKCYRPIV